MKEFIFIFGKNPSLSLAEIVCYLEARSVNFEITDSSDIFASVRLENLPKNIMNDLGGTLKIAETIYSGDNFEGVSIDFDKFSRSLPDKLVFGVSSYISQDEQERFSDFFKKGLKKCGIKAGYIHTDERPALTHVEVIKKKLIEESFEIIICEGKKKHLGRTVFVHNPYEFQKRDISRPEQRKMYSIPPRLCKIMINLSKASKGILLDPFCGIGTVLQEAALMGFAIRGVDIDGDAIQSCLKNMNWFEREYGLKLDRKIITGDSRNLLKYFDENSVDVIVAEPYLGPALIEKPNENEAKKILSDLEGFYEKIIKSMLKVLKPGSRMVVISPSFRIGSGFMRIDVNKMINDAKLIDPLKKYGVEHEFPFFDFEERHSTIREINIVEKDV